MELRRDEKEMMYVVAVSVYLILAGLLLSIGFSAERELDDETSDTD